MKRKLIVSLVLTTLLPIGAAYAQSVMQPLNTRHPEEGYQLITPGQPTTTVRPFNSRGPNSGYWTYTPGEPSTTIITPFHPSVPDTEDQPYAPRGFYHYYGNN